MVQDQADPAEQTAPSSMAHDPYEVFRDANYRRFLLAGMAATIGNQMQSVAVGWELYGARDRRWRWGWWGWPRCSPSFSWRSRRATWQTGTAEKPRSCLPICCCWRHRRGSRMSFGKARPDRADLSLPRVDGRGAGDEPPRAVGGPSSDHLARALALGRDLEHQHLADRRDGRPRAWAD